MATSGFVDASKWGRAAQLHGLIKRERGSVILASRAPASHSDKNSGGEKKHHYQTLPLPRHGSEYVCLSSSCVHPYTPLIPTLTSIIRRFLFFPLSRSVIGAMLMTSAVISDFLLIFIRRWPEQSEVELRDLQCRAPICPDSILIWIIRKILDSNATLIRCGTLANPRNMLTGSQGHLFFYAWLKVLKGRKFLDRHGWWFQFIFHPVS